MAFVKVPRGFGWGRCTPQTVQVKWWGCHFLPIAEMQLPSTIACPRAELVAGATTRWCRTCWHLAHLGRNASLKSFSQ